MTCIQAITRWRPRLLEGAADVFGPGPTPAEPRVDATVHTRICELTPATGLSPGAVGRPLLLRAKRWSAVVMRCRSSPRRGRSASAATASATCPARFFGQPGDHARDRRVAPAPSFRRRPDAARPVPAGRRGRRSAACRDADEADGVGGAARPGRHLAFQAARLCGQAEPPHYVLQADAVCGCHGGIEVRLRARRSASEMAGQRASRSGSPPRTWIPFASVPAVPDRPKPSV